MFSVMFSRVKELPVFSYISRHRHLIKSLIISFFLIGMATLVMLPMCLHGYPITHSTQFNLSWIFQYQRQFQSGQIYPRWLEFSNFGFGNPTFVFYPPMLAVATLPFSLLGLDLSTSLISSMMLAAFILALGTYFYASLYFPSWLAIAIAGLAVASPYFLIDVYQRGAIAEVWAICFIPWVLLATHKLISQAHLPPMQRTHVISLAITWGMLGLSHLPTLLISFLAWLAMPLCLCSNFKNGSSWSKYIVEVGYCYLSASLGFVGISFFLMPVIFDQSLVQIDSINFSTEYLPQYRLLLDSLLSFHPKISTHWFETRSGLIPYFWIVVSTLTINLIIKAIANKYYSNFLSNISPQTNSDSQLESSSLSNQISLDRSMLSWSFTVAIALLMTTDLDVWVYQLLPVLQKIQFSWRWYGLTVTTMPMLLGGTFWNVWQLAHIFITREKLLKSLTQPLFVSFLLISLIITSYIYTDKIVFQHTGFDSAIITKFSQLTTEKTFPKEPDIQAKGTPILWWHWIFPDGLAIVDVPEYRAKGVNLPMPPYRNYSLAAWQEDNSIEHIQIKRWQYGLREILVDNPSSGSLNLDLRMFYYPAWQVWIDGKKALLGQTEQGQAQIEVASGSHSILVKYTGTHTEKLGRSVSCFSIAIAIYIFWQVRKNIKETNIKSNQNL